MRAPPPGTHRRLGLVALARAQVQQARWLQPPDRIGAFHDQTVAGRHGECIRRAARADSRVDDVLFLSWYSDGPCDLHIIAVMAKTFISPKNSPSCCGDAPAVAQLKARAWQEAPLTIEMRRG